MDENKEIIDFIQKRTGIVATSKTKIFEDLGIDGLDAETFMKEFSEEFKVDISNYESEKYSISEKDLSNIFLKIYYGLFNRKKLEKKFFTIEHLNIVAKKGVWFDP